MTVKSRPLIGIGCRTIDVSNRDRSFIGVFESYAETVLKSGGDPILLPFSDNTNAIGHCKGLLLAGGEDLSKPEYWKDLHCSKQVDVRRDAFEIKLIKYCAENRKPLLGICRGAQLINCLFDGLLSRTEPADDCDHGGQYESRHYVRLKQKSLLSNAYAKSRELDVLSRHSAVITKLGRNLTPVAWAPDDTIEAFESELWPCWGIMWHVEWNGEDKPTNLAPVQWLIDQSSGGGR